MFLQIHTTRVVAELPPAEGSRLHDARCMFTRLRQLTL